MNIKLTRFLLLLIISLSLLTMVLSSTIHAQKKRGQVVASDEVQTTQARMQAQFPPPKSDTFKIPPDQPPVKKVNPPKLFNPPVDPSLRPEDIRPMNAETVVNIKSENDSSASLAPGTFTIYRNTSLASAPVVGGATLRGFIPIEPSVANNGRVVFYTTNSYVGYSGDGGQTFTYLNPFDYFPADGTNDPIDGGFGGDQYVYYERTRGLTFWLLQYKSNGATNRQRLCISRSQEETLTNPCAYFFDFSPASFNIPTPAGTLGTWLDFPDVAVSDNMLYLTSNVFACNATPCGQNSTSVGAVVWRISLNELRQPGTINFVFSYDAARFGFRLSQGAKGTMYWGSHINTGQIRIYRWADNSGNFFFDDVTHNGYNTGAMTANSPDGTNFAEDADSKIQAAWVAGGVIGFMWNAAQSTPPTTTFPFPHVQVLRFNESNRTLLSQGQIFSPTTAFLYPSVQVNARGHLGGTMAWGGGSFYPNALAWIADDYNGGTITPLENATFAVGSAGPKENDFGIFNRWGDYLATRLHIPYRNTWIGTGFVYQSGSPPAGNQRDPHYVWFGRERDTPPANQTIYVDLFNTTGFEDGTIAHPYNTVREGHFASSPGDTIVVTVGNYNEPIILNRPSTITTLGGTVIIGRP